MKWAYAGLPRPAWPRLRRSSKPASTSAARATYKQAAPCAAARGLGARRGGWPRPRAPRPRSALERLRQRRRRQVERRELLEQLRDPRRIGLLVDAVERRTRRGARRGRATRSLVRTISCSISRCASVCSTAFAPITSPSASKLELGLGGGDLERVRCGARPAAAAARAGEVERRRRRRRGRLGSGEEAVELVVVEALVGADAAAVEARRARLTARPEDDLRGHRQAVDAGREAAGVGAEARRQHRLGGAGHVDARRPPQRLGIEPRAGAYVGG